MSTKLQASKGPEIVEKERPTKDECIASVERELARAIVKLGIERARVQERLGETGNAGKRPA